MTAVSLLLLSLTAADAGQPSSRGVLLDFTATWCGPCQQMNPIVSRLKRQGYPVRKVDVDRERGLAQKFNVRSMPTFILVVDGKEQNRIVGMTSESQLRRLLNQIPRGRKTPRQTRPESRNVATTHPRRNPRVAENDASKNSSKTPARRSPGFTFPLGKKSASERSPRREPAVIRAKLDQEDDAPEPPISVKEEPLASSVRVRINNEDGVNYGSGTIIQSQKGRTVILTCGHIFRDLKPDAKIEVDVFTGNESQTFVGKTIGYDLEGDVGLLAINTDSALPTSSLGGLGDVRRRESVYSIGCGGGDRPSREDLHVTALNRYLGPENIECTGVPRQGRSGGGLFNADGEIVGVCVAADPRDQRGLYAGTKVIHQLLKKHDFAKLLPESLPAKFPVIAKTDANPRPKKDPKVAPPVKTTATKGREISLPAGLKTPGEAEVICIVRPLDQPKSASRVVIINRASSRFVSYLTQEIEDQPVPTMYQRIQEEQADELEAPPFAEFAEEESARELEPPPFAEPNHPTIERYRRSRTR